MKHKELNEEQIEYLLTHKVYASKNKCYTLTMIPSNNKERIEEFIKTFKGTYSSKYIIRNVVHGGSLEIKHAYTKHLDEIMSMVELL